MAKMKNSLAKSASELRESRASSSTKYCEYAVHKDKTFKTYLGKVGAIFAPIAAFIGLIVIISSFGLPGAALAPVYGVSITVVIYFMMMLMRYTNVEFEYVLCDGQMEMVKIYGSAKRKILFRQKILDMEIIAPANGEYAETYKDYLDESKYDKVLRCCTNMNTKDLYFAVFNHEKLGKTLVYFNGIKKSVDIFRYHTTKTIVKPGIL